MEQRATCKGIDMKTALYEHHKQLNAKMVDFCGWQMPVQYKGIIPEHLAVRTKAGLFDVSHMGRISITGKDAEAFLDYLSTNQIKEKPTTARPTPFGPWKLGAQSMTFLFIEKTMSIFL